jgi:hypothetical protein
MPKGHYVRRPGPRWPLMERFEKHFTPEPNSGCFIWTGAVDGHGYGHMRNNKGTTGRAHRVSWELYCGPIPAGNCVLHRCDMPCCVNPEHLFLGTQKDNVADCVRKNRRDIHPPGPGHPGNKLSLDEVIAIKQSKHGPTHLARQFGVSPTHVCAIQKGRRHSNK